LGLARIFRSAAGPQPKPDGFRAAVHTLASVSRRPVLVAALGCDFHREGKRIVHRAWKRGLRSAISRFMTTPALPESHVPAVFSHKFGSLIKCVLGGYDRLRFRGTLRPLFSPRWMRALLCGAKILLKDFAHHAQNISQQIGERARQAAADHQRPYHYLRGGSSDFDKAEWAERIAQQDPVREGLIAVLGAVEPCSAMTVRANHQTQRLEPVHEYRKCLHFYHYFEDPTFGRCHVRVQSWYPFTVDICLNGRAMLARQMDERKLAYLKADNCFLALADPQAAQKLADKQLRLDWVAHLNRLLALAHPVHRQVLVPLFRLEYYWTSAESEYATDLVFKDPEQLAKLYPCFVHHGIMTFRTPRVMRFLGHQVPLQSGRVNGRFKGPARSDRLERYEGVCLRHGVGINGIKIYDKFAQVLRVETTLNAPEVFKVYRTDPAQPIPKPTALSDPKKAPLSPPRKKPTNPAVLSTGKPPPVGLQAMIRTNSCVGPQNDQPPRRWQRLRRSVADLSRRAEVSRAANGRYLEALASTRGTEPLGAAVKALCQPVRKDGYRFRALNPLSPPDATLLEALSRGEWTINGFRNADLRKHLYPTRSCSTEVARHRTAAVSRKLRLLRAHGLIRKVPGSHRYLLTPQGRKLTTLLTAARNADVQQLTAFAA
jgi:hypothetical protein